MEGCLAGILGQQGGTRKERRSGGEAVAVGWTSLMECGSEQLQRDVGCASSSIHSRISALASPTCTVVLLV